MDHVEPPNGLVIVVSTSRIWSETGFFRTSDVRKLRSYECMTASRSADWRRRAHLDVPPSLLLGQLRQKSFRGFQIGRLKTFREPAIDWLKQRFGLGGMSLRLT